MKLNLVTTLYCSLIFVSSHATAKEELYFYNWSEYIPNDILKEFTRETGINVIYSTYESNESMYAKLKTQRLGYDLVVPSTYFIAKMIKEDMLQSIDHKKLSYFADLDPNFTNKRFDPDNNYSIPYVWGATGIGVNLDHMQINELTNWVDLWNIKWRKKLMMLDDAREFFHIALSTLGYAPNTTNENEIKAAYEELKKLMPNILVFNSDNPADPYVAGEVSAGMLWNGSAYIAQKEGMNIKMIWPKNTIFWMDNLAIPVGAKNIDAAHKMINFLLKPENAAKIALKVGYPTPVKTAYDYLPSSFVNNTNVFPPLDVIENGIWQSDVGEASMIYEKYFQMLKINSQ